jgi:hypothetical protein
VSSVKYEPDFYIPEEAIVHSHRRENLKCYIVLILIKFWAAQDFKKIIK